MDGLIICCSPMSSKIYRLLDTIDRIIANGYLGWLMQRITAIVILVCGAIHVFYVVFTFERIPPNPLLLYSLLLLAGLYHALNGLKTILAEWGYGLGKTLNLNIVLFVVGVVIAWFGLSTLYTLYG